MKIIHQSGYSVEELHNYRSIVFKNLLECARAVIVAMRTFDIELAIEENQQYADFLMEYSVESGPQASIDSEVGVAIRAIWTDPAKEQLMERQAEFYLMDSAE
jgi:guanine nucleotide-binding protein G(i) subunit alpha